MSVSGLVIKAAQWFSSNFFFVCFLIAPWSAFFCYITKTILEFLNKPRLLYLCKKYILMYLYNKNSTSHSIDLQCAEKTALEKETGSHLCSWYNSIYHSISYHKGALTRFKLKLSQDTKQ